MTERNNEYFQQYVGMKIGPDRYRIKGKKLSAYAKAVGDLNPKYYVEPPKEEGVKADYSKIVAHPSYASTYTIPGVLMSLPEVVDDKGEKLIKNIGKLLHTAQIYDYEGCESLRAADKQVITTGVIKKLFLKGDKLWVEILFTSTNQDKSKIFCKTTLKGLMRKGGY